jgi:hypothetical protein
VSGIDGGTANPLLLIKELLYIEFSLLCINNRAQQTPFGIGSRDLLVCSLAPPVLGGSLTLSWPPVVRIFRTKATNLKFFFFFLLNYLFI